jgi:predicted metal-dependent HD superfamily phosphohydrolase
VSALDRNRWNNLCGNSSPKAARWFGRLRDLYSEPHRQYHNDQHIVDCLSEFDPAWKLAHEPLAVELAIWFHDAIYNPRAADNEERSADLATQFINETGIARGFQSAVAQLVLATKHHYGSLHRDTVLIVDIDLSILGQNPERFWKYEEQIRREYEWVPQDVFAVKRAEILERFLSRSKIFGTEFFFGKCEAQARLNLAESIRRLKNS